MFMKFFKTFHVAKIIVKMKIITHYLVFYTLNFIFLYNFATFREIFEISRFAKINVREIQFFGLAKITAREN